MTNDVLKNLAQRAKRRLINNGEKNVKDINISIRSSACKIRYISNKDEKFNEKARKLIEADEEIINPIKLLMDENLYNKLDDNGKERYLLKTIDNFTKLKMEIEKEKENSLSLFDNAN